MLIPPPVCWQNQRCYTALTHHRPTGCQSQSRKKRFQQHKNRELACCCRRSSVVLICSEWEKKKSPDEKSHLTVAIFRVIRQDNLAQFLWLCRFGWRRARTRPMMAVWSHCCQHRRTRADGDDGAPARLGKVQTERLNLISSASPLAAGKGQDPVFLLLFCRTSGLGDEASWRIGSGSNCLSVGVGKWTLMKRKKIILGNRGL